MLTAGLYPHQYLGRFTRLARIGAGVTLLVTLACVDASPLERVQPGHWYEIPDSRLSKVVARQSIDGSPAGITAWSGGALDPQTNQLIIWGGGHGDYAGNEVYAFDLDVLEWTRLTDPSLPDRDGTDTYADGAPRSRHTYNYIEFLPTQRKLLSFGGAALYPRGGATSRSIAEFDPQTRTWVNGRRREVPAGGSIIGAHARLDPVSGDVFFVPSQRGALVRYSPARDEWRGGWDTTYVRVHATAAIDPKRRLMVLIGSGTDKAQALTWNLDRPGPARDLRTITSGEKDIERAYAPGFDFHAPSARLVAWAGGTVVYVLDPDNWRWTRLSAAPGNTVDPGPHRATGTYGRFRYVPGLDVFVLMNGVDRNVFVLRLPPL